MSHMRNGQDKQKQYTAQKERWKRIKVKAIVFKGSKCSCCGTQYDGTNACIFDFHHLDPSSKLYDWSKLRLRTWGDIESELQKCILLCSNCHRQLHSDKF